MKIYKDPSFYRFFSFELKNEAYGELERKMKLHKLELSLPIVNHDGVEEANKEKRHGLLLPDTVRGIVAGSSGCGKTNVILSLIEHPNGLRFQNIFVVSKSLDQAKYKRIEHIVKPLKEIKFYGLKDVSEIPEKPPKDSVFIFDDLVGSKQTMIQKYYSYGRHFKVDSFFLSQTYCSVKKHLLRDNANFIILFQQDDVNLKHVFNEHVSGLKFSQFKEMCSIAWSEPFGFLTIDKESKNYRKGFDQVFTL